MLPKNIKIPMIIGTGLYITALLADIVFLIVQKEIFMDQIREVPKETIFPFIVLIHILVVCMFIIFLLIMMNYKGKARRAAGVIMIVIYSVVSVVSPYTTWLTHIISAQFGGSAVLAAVTTLESYITIITTPFTVAASVLALIAIGRYGVSAENTDKEQL